MTYPFPPGALRNADEIDDLLAKGGAVWLVCGCKVCLAKPLPWKRTMLSPPTTRREPPLGDSYPEVSYTSPITNNRAFANFWFAYAYMQKLKSRRQ
jgi:hypothetical protein